VEERRVGGGPAVPAMGSAVDGAEAAGAVAPAVPAPPPDRSGGARLRSRAGRRGRAPAALVLPALAVAAAVNLPLVYLSVRSAEGGLDRYLATVGSARTLGLVGSTVGLVAGVVAASLAVAVPLAWLVARTDLPARRFWAVAGALPLVFPSYVSAFALVAVLGPRGYLQGWLQALLGVERLPGLIYGYGGALAALALFTYPYTYLLLVAALRRTDPALEETSRALGRGRWRTFFAVVLPQLRPALYAGSLLVALYTLSDFGAVSIVRYDTFTLSIYNAYRGLFDRTVAASLATVLVALTVALIAVEALLLRRVRPVRPGAGRPAERVHLGRWRWPALAGVGALTLVTLGLPLGVVLYWGVRALALGHPLGAAGGAALGSLGASLAAAFAAVALALPAAAWAARHPSRAARAVERASHAGYALPGIVIALSLVFFVSRSLPSLYQTATLLVAAYVVRFLPEALAAARSAFAAVPRRFEEAARSLGRGPLGVLAGLTLPLVRPGLLAGGGLVFLTAMKELPATLILRPIGFETLATRVWSAASEGIYSEAALPALLLVAASAPPVWALIIRPALAERGAP
jgi:iron(III) transport system permease protein